MQEKKLKKNLETISTAVARTLIGGGGGVFIHIFMFCPTSFFEIKFKFINLKRNYSRAELEYMNKHPPLLTF